MATKTELQALVDAKILSGTKSTTAANLRTVSDALIDEIFTSRVVGSGTLNTLPKITNVGSDTITIGDSLISDDGSTIVISGGLQVMGVTTTIDSTVVTVEDPIFTLGGNTPPIVDDNKDRGIDFHWHNGSSAKLGFFGMDDTDSRFKFIPDATNTSEVFSGSVGDAEFGNIYLSGIQINTGASDGYFLKSDGSGNGSWAELTSSDISDLGLQSTLDSGSTATLTTETVSITVDDSGTSNTLIEQDTSSIKLFNEFNGNDESQLLVGNDLVKISSNVPTLGYSNYIEVTPNPSFTLNLTDSGNTQFSKIEASGLGNLEILSAQNDVEGDYRNEIKLTTSDFLIKRGNWNDTSEKSLDFTTGMTVTDSVDSKGLVYASDYSANFTARSLVDKGYVDASFAPTGTYALVGTYTDGYVPRWNSTTNTLESGNIQDDGTSVTIGGTTPTITNALTLGAFTLPNTDGTVNQVLTTDGAGVVSWEDSGGSLWTEAANGIGYSEDEKQVVIGETLASAESAKLYIKGDDNFDYVLQVDGTNDGLALAIDEATRVTYIEQLNVSGSPADSVYIFETNGRLLMYGSAPYIRIHNTSDNELARLGKEVNDGQLRLYKGATTTTQMLKLGGTGDNYENTGENIIFGDNTGALARVHVKGTGSGSGTVAFLCTNIDDDDLLKVLDIGRVTAEGQLGSSIQAVSSPSGTTETIDWEEGNYSILDLEDATGDVTLTLSNPVAGFSYFIEIRQDSTTPRDVTFPSNVKFPGETAPYTLDVSSGANAVDSVALAYNGTDYLATFAQNHG